MYKKYRIYLQTTRGGYSMGAADSVNGLAAIVTDWLENTSAGRSVSDYYDRDPLTKELVRTGSDVQKVMLYELDQDTGAYKFSKEAAATHRGDIIRAVRSLGAR